MNFLRGFLDNDSAFGRLMTRCGILIAANILFALSTIPILTVGAGWAALYHVLLRTLRGDGELNPFLEFWKGLRSNWKQASICWICVLCLLIFLALEWYWCGQFGGAFLVWRFGLVMIAAAVVVLAIYLFPTMAAFAASIPNLLRFSLYFALKKPLYLLVILFFHLFPPFLTYSDLGTLPLYAFLWCTVGFAAVGMVTATLLLQEFQPFLPAVGAYGDFLAPEGNPDSESMDSGAGEKSEWEILEDMKKLGM